MSRPADMLALPPKDTIDIQSLNRAVKALEAHMDGFEVIPMHS